MKRLVIGAAFLCLAALVSAGCGRGRLEGESAPGEMVLFGETARIRGFDPVKAGDVASALASGRIYEGLLQYAYLDRPYHVEPLLAEAMPKVSRDGLTYTFKIRKGICFQDDPCFTNTAGKGRELVADDFIYAIKRVSDMKNASSGFWAFNDRIVGLDEWRAAAAGGPSDYAKPVGGLQAPDPHTLRIRLKRPYPQLLWILTMHYSFAIPREAVAYYGTEFVNHPVGTGPYILKSYRQNYRYEFVRNPKWAETGRQERYPSSSTDTNDRPELLADAGKQLPFVDRVVQYVVDDSTTEWLMFLTGDFEASGVSRDNWDAVITQDRNLTPDLERQGIRLLTTPTLDLFYIGFNMDDPVVGTNQLLRQAMTCAFNTDEWIRFYNGRVRRPDGPIPPGVSGYAERPYPFPFDLERARKLLAEAGYPEGKDPKTGRRLQLTLELGSADPETRQSAELFASFMEKIGVVVKPGYNNWPAFLEKMERRQAQLFSLGWVADYPDAENFLQLFYGPNSSPGPNHANYANPAFDRLYEKAREMQDSPERTALYQRMADIVVEDCPWLLTSNPLAYGLQHDWFKNYKYHDFPYGMVKYHRIDVAARAKWKTEYGRK